MGMPVVNYDLLYIAALKAKGDFNQVVYWSRLPDWKNQTLTPNATFFTSSHLSTPKKSDRWSWRSLRLTVEARSRESVDDCCRRLPDAAPVYLFTLQEGEIASEMAAVVLQC